MPDENQAFIARVDPASPPEWPRHAFARIAAEETGGGAGYCPRVRYAYVAGRLSS